MSHSRITKMKEKGSFGEQNCWRFNVKGKPLRVNPVKVLFEETWYKSAKDENERPMRVKSVIVLFEETRYKSFEG
jgi:hypothetical protein